MTNMKKLLMFAASGLLAPMAVTPAHAEVGSSTQTLMFPSPVNDKAPVSGTPTRLRRTDEEQPGNEMPTMAMFADGINGLYFSMNTELPPTAPGGAVRPATHRMQLAAVPFSLTQMADGKVTVAPKIAESKFVTNNIGNEYRNANAPCAYPIFGGEFVAVKYNYQANGTNDTKAYLQVFDKTGAAVMGQTLLFAKNNDDAFMQQDGKCGEVVTTSPTTQTLVFYAGANGNGDDDGWFGIRTLTKTATGVTLAKVADGSLCPREERSRGNCSVAASDPNTAICTWTEGNTQPQRDGTWMAAVNIGAGGTGDNVQSRILWKKQIEGRKDIEGIRTYSMRAMHERVIAVNATTGKLENTNQMIWRSGDLRGNNNTNGKGGTYYRSQMGVIEATAAGMKYITPLQDVSLTLTGLDGTHLGMAPALVGTTNALTPGIIFLGGSHTGGGTSSQARVVTWDAATNSFASAAMMGLAPHDRHLYPNYLGNNPGNQGRNHSAMQMVANPFVGMNANTDAYLMLAATSGKEAALMMYPERKASAFLSVLPIAQTPKVVTPGTGTGSGSGSGSGTGTGEGGGTGETGGDEAGTALGGCSTGGSTGGLIGFLLIGLAAFGIRRRR